MIKHNPSRMFVSADEGVTELSLATQQVPPIADISHVSRILHWLKLEHCTHRYYRILHWHRPEHCTHVEYSSMSPHLLFTFSRCAVFSSIMVRVRCVINYCAQLSSFRIMVAHGWLSNRQVQHRWITLRISTYRTRSSYRSATSRNIAPKQATAHSVTLTNMATQQVPPIADISHVSHCTHRYYRILHWDRQEHCTHVECSSMSPHLS